MPGFANCRATATASILLMTGLACGEPARNPGPDPSTNPPGTAEVVAPPEASIVAGQSVYVPAYSHVETGDNRQPLNLSATLFIRNTDPSRPIVLTGVKYFDSAGKPIRDFLPKPIRVGPMASASFFVEESDSSGGGSPSFLVDWVATEPPSEPIVESVMIGTSGTQGISFTSTGRVIRSRHAPR